MAIVADYSAGLPGAAALKEAGFIGAVRYIGSPGNIKCATADELRDFDAHGLGMGLVFEQTAGQWRNGFAQGQSDAVAARAHASAIGYPLDRPIYFAVDQDVVNEWEQLDSYADGWASILGHELCGPYGEYDVVIRCWNRGFKWTWQCRAWSGTPAKMFDQRKLFQYFGSPFTDDGRNVVVNGVEVDTNDVNADDWGQHNAHAQPPGGGASGPEEEETMKEVTELPMSMSDKLIAVQVDPTRESRLVLSATGKDQLIYVVTSYHWAAQSNGEKVGTGGNPVPEGGIIHVRPGRPLVWFPPKGTAEVELVYSTAAEGGRLAVFA